MAKEITVSELLKKLEELNESLKEKFDYFVWFHRKNTYSKIYLEKMKEKFPSEYEGCDWKDINAWPVREGDYGWGSDKCVEINGQMLYGEW
jgi:hypothetical protein